MTKRILLLLLLLTTIRLAYPQTPTNLYKETNQRKMNQWVDSVFNTLSMDEKIGQLFMVVADPGSSYHDRIIKNIKEQKIGGVLFSGGKLVDQARSINLYQENSRVPLLISFDGEWGLAMRLKDDTPLFPHNMMIGAIQDNNLIRLYGKEVGRECNELGVHINFAPVLDVNVNPANPVIGNRSFGEDPHWVAEKGIAYSRGLESQLVMAVGKHFPGHGDTSDDSHKTLPKISHNRERLEKIELYPFRQYIKAGFGGVMTGHLSVPALDKTTGLPTSLSPRIVKDLLVDELGFTGLTFTDALVMEGASGGRHSTCVQALLAGNDILLSPGKPVVEYDAVKKAVESGTIPQSLIEEKCRKVLQYKYIAGLSDYKPIQTQGLSERINSSHAEFLIQKLNEAAITLLKNEGEQSIPVKKLDEKRIAVVSLGETKPSPFYETLSLYADMDFFPSEGAIGDMMLSRLKKYDCIIIAIHSSKTVDGAALQTLCKQKEVHLCFFVSPYRLSRFKSSIKEANSVTMAYENTRPAQEAAAQVIMGGIPARGKLPVSIPGMFDLGRGLSTKKLRLSYGKPEEAGISGVTLNEIADVVKEGIDEQAFPGCQVLIAKNGVVIYNQAFGHFDYTLKRPVKTTDLYDLASVTKAVATVPAVMKLYDKKQLSLNDPISKYVRPLQGTDKKYISIRDALYHESGLRPFLPFYTSLIDTASYSGPLFSNTPSSLYCIAYDKKVFMRNDFRFYPQKVSESKKEGYSKQIAESLFVKDAIDKEVIEVIAASPLLKNKSYTYSDLNFILLKEMVENISKERFDKFLDRNFYDRLGATSTMFLPLRKYEKEDIAPTEEDNFLRSQLLQGYVHDEAAAVLGGISGNAGLFSNANDLAKLLQMFLNQGSYGGETYLSKETVRLFTTSKSDNSRRGLGFDKPDKNNKNKSPTANCVPVSTYGHTGYTGTCFWVDPDNNIIFIFLSNRVHPSRMQTNLMNLNIRPRIQDIIYRSIL